MCQLIFVYLFHQFHFYLNTPYLKLHKYQILIVHLHLWHQSPKVILGPRINIVINKTLTNMKLHISFDAGGISSFYTKIILPLLSTKQTMRLRSLWNMFNYYNEMIVRINRTFNFTKTSMKTSSYWHNCIILK